MFIKTLSLRNFKTIKEAEFKFKKGVICFTGNNGEGKSTVLHAIMLLLFNTTYEGTLKDSIRWGEKEFNISMEFEHEGVSYSESLTYSLTKGSDRILVNQLTDESFTGASAISKLSEIIDPEQARAAMVSMENEQNLVTTTPSQRREYLKKIYSLEFKQELTRIASDVEKVDNDIITAKAQKELLEASEYPLKEEKEVPSESLYQKAKDKLALYEQELKELKSQQTKAQELRTERGAVENTIRGLERKAEEAKEEISRAKEEIETFDSELRKLEGIDYDIMESDEKNSLLADYEADKQTAQENIKRARTELDKIPETLVRINRSNYEKLSSKQAELRHAVEESSSKLGVLRQGKCPTCGRDISPEEAEREKEKLGEFQKSLQAITEQFEQEKKRLDKLQEDNTARQNLRFQWEKTRDKFVQELESLEKSYKLNVEKITLKYQSRRSELNLKRTGLQSKIDIRNSTIESSTKLVDSYKAQIKDYEANRDKLKAEEAKYEDITEAISGIRIKMAEPGYLVKDYEDAVAYNKSVQVYNEEMKKKTAERDSKINELAGELEYLSARKSMILVAKGIVQKEFPSFVISRMVQALSDYVNEFLDKVYPKYQISIEEGKNSLNILYGDYKTDVKMASGFEKSAFSLAYMYALGKIQAYGLLICDEGDAAASDENSAKFYKMLGKSTDWLNQIMCITHKEEIKELLRNDFHAQIFTVENGEYREEIA